MSTQASAVPERRRLPNRRPSETRTLHVGNLTFAATVGFDPDDGQPREIFLAGAKDGTEMAAILDDVAVALSIALQHDIPAAALAKSVGRLPEGPVMPADLDKVQPSKRPASPIGAALDLLQELDSTSPRSQGNSHV